MKYSFPQFRRLANGKAVYSIEADMSMVEYQILGPYYFIYEITGKILPERNLVYDILTCESDRWSVISKIEFEKFKNECEKDKERRQ
jgi:hypothetical protein